MNGGKRSRLLKQFNSLLISGIVFDCYIASGKNISLWKFNVEKCSQQFLLLNICLTGEKVRTTEVNVDLTLVSK